MRIGDRELPPAASWWEYGSHPHLVEPDDYADADEEPGIAPWSGKPHSFFGSGRGAMQGLFTLLHEEAHLRSLSVPSFFCGEVVQHFLEGPLTIATYDASPWRDLHDPCRLPRGDVILTTNYFGMAPPPDIVRAGNSGMTVEDHTHDPFSGHAYQSRADYAVASLRKSLPLPEGAVVWSPRGHEVPSPDPPNAEHERVVRQRIEAMARKRTYLLSGGGSQDSYLGLLRDAEARATDGGSCAWSTRGERLFGTLPTFGLRERRRRNAELLITMAEERGWQVLRVRRAEDQAPYVVPLSLPHRVDHGKTLEALRAVGIFLPVLWADAAEWPAVRVPTREQAKRDVRRVLFLPCDYRYSPDDLEHVVESVTDIVKQQAVRP